MSAKIIRKIGLFSWVVVLSVILFGSGGALADQWAITYGGTEEDKASSIQQTSEGGYVAAGSTSSSGAGKLDIWVLKLDVSGNVEWQKTYGGAEDDEAASVRQAEDGGYVVAGYTSSSGAGKKDVWVLKLDKDGSVEWQKTYGGSGDDVAYSIQQTSDEKYIVAGSTDSFGKGKKDMWVLKLDEGGNIDWQKTYGEIGDDEAYSINPTSDGGYVVAGQTNSYSTKIKPWILKLDSDGNIQDKGQVIILGGTGEDRIYSIQEISDGGYILAGSTDSYGLGKKDAWIIKIDASGTMHQTLFGGTGEDEAFSIQETMDRGYVVAGWSGSFGAGHHDAWVMKLDSNLDILGCSIIGSSFASLGSTGISGVSTNAAPQDTELLPQTSNVPPANTEVTPGSICMAKGPDISVKPTSVDFGSIVMGTLSSQTVTVTNVGSQDLRIKNVDIPQEGNYQDFGIRDDGCSNLTLKPFNSCVIEVSFLPNDVNENAILIIPSDDSDFGNLRVVLKGIGIFPISPTEPPNKTSFSACSLYEPPTFAWDVESSFKDYQILFSKSGTIVVNGTIDFTKIAVKVKTTSNKVTIKSNIWKQLMLIPGEMGGPVYWWVLGTFPGGKTGSLTDPFHPRSITIEPAQSVKNAQIAPTSINSLPTVSWENNCNVKFKVWFGNDMQFSKKYTFSPPTIKNPLNNNGEFSQTLTSRQWDSIQKLVGNQSGSTVYWKVESWDGANRESQTASPMSFVLTE